jgi:hypothetical protein
MTPMFNEPPVDKSKSKTVR